MGSVRRRLSTSAYNHWRVDVWVSVVATPACTHPHGLLFLILLGLSPQVFDLFLLQSAWEVAHPDVPTLVSGVPLIR